MRVLPYAFECAATATDRPARPVIHTRSTEQFSLASPHGLLGGGGARATPPLIRAILAPLSVSFSFSGVHTHTHYLPAFRRWRLPRLRRMFPLHSGNPCQSAALPIVGDIGGGLLCECVCVYVFTDISKRVLLAMQSHNRCPI